MDSLLDDPAFIKAFQAGDHFAFKRMYEATVDRLEKWMYKNHSDIQEADKEDLISDAYCHVFVKRHKIDSISLMQTFLIQHLKHRIIDAYRIRSGRWRATEGILYVLKESEVIENNELEDMTLDLHNAIQLLPNRQRQVIQMNIIHGIPVSEISVLTKLSRQTILNTKRKAIDKLIKALNPQNNAKRHKIFV